ncbi:MAG: DUF6773 family protein [Blautia wexlerae]
MKIRKMKSNLDERQELKLLKIEHNGCWIAFWGLLIVMAIQMIVGNDSIKNLAGEGAVLYESCLLSFGCMYPKWNLGQEIETEFQDECHSQ